MTRNQISSEKQQELLETLKIRFQKFPNRHQGINWVEIKDRLLVKPEKLNSLFQMELTGGEPDVVVFDQKTGDYIFMDCSPQSPSGRRSLCYDQEALESRKVAKPKGSAQKLAADMGVELLDESHYRHLQTLGEFDTKTSSWLSTPPLIRNLGGAIFGDRRYGQVFIYHNGADSYYAARGFRCLLRV